MALSQSQYRFGGVDGTESTHSWLSGLSRAVNRQAGATGQFLLRIGLQETAGVNENNVSLKFQVQKNGGGYQDVTTSSSIARTGTNAVFAGGANCTKRLSGTGTFEATAAGCTTTGSCGGSAMDVVASGCTEVLIGLQIMGADVVVGDLLEFRLVRSTGTLLTTYAVTPSVRVATEILAVASQDNTAHFSQSAGVNKIRNTLIVVEVTGVSASDLADGALAVTTNVWGTTVVGSTDPADYTTLLQGPDVWNGGHVGKDGLPIAPGFGFAQDIPEGVRRVLATFQPSRTTTFGAQATIVE